MQEQPKHYLPTVIPDSSRVSRGDVRNPECYRIHAIVSTLGR